MTDDVAERAEQVLQKAVESEGAELLHVQYEPRGDSSVLRLFIDKPGGINLKDCERVSKHVSVLLDVEDFIPHHYVLEVSSPGIERPLFKEADYERFMGEEIRLETLEKIQGRRKFRGVIRGFSQRVLELESEGEVYRIDFGAIKKANLVDPGGPRR